MTTIQIPTVKEVEIKEIRLACRVGPANITLHGKGGMLLAKGDSLAVPAFLDGAPEAIELHISTKGKILNWNEISPEVLEALYRDCTPVEPEQKDKAAPKKPRKPRRKKGESDADYAKRVAEAAAAAAAEDDEDREAAE